MNHISVSSSNVKSIGYENGTLEVNFISKNSLYQYFGVPETVYKALMNAGSKTTFLRHNVYGKYRELKIR